MDISKIITSKAVDKEAKAVTSEGVHYEPTLPASSIITYDCKPATRQPNCFERKSKTFISLAGRRFGRFVVMGLSVDVPKRWVVRCDCGKYELRTSKYIKNAKNVTNAMCQYCLHARSTRNKYRNYEKWLTMGAPRREQEEQKEREKNAINNSDDQRNQEG
jgi:hypothetical protein